jgi:hypothetical protein
LKAIDVKQVEFLADDGALHAILGGLTIGWIKRTDYC